MSIPENLNLKIIEQDNYNAIYHSYAGVVASGTATLESAILGMPFLIIYKTSFINYLILKPQIKVPFIGMVNLIFKEKVIPELVQYRLNSSSHAKEIDRLLTNEKYYNDIKNKLEEFKNLLADKGAAQRAAEYILNILNE